MKAYVLLFAALISAEAFASKARVNSLLGADHLVDTQTVFTVPSHVQLLSPYMTFEFGAQGAGAEGGIMRKLGEGSLMLYVGHQNVTGSAAQGDIRTANGFIGQNNPLEAVYGFGNMGVGLSISQVDNDTADTKETTVVGKFGMNFTNESWAWVHFHTYSTAEKASTTAGQTDEVSSSPYLTGGASYAINNWRVFGQLDFSRGNLEMGGGADQDVNDMNLRVGVEDRSLKTENADIYYGIAFAYAKREYEDNEISAHMLPVFLGIEAPVVSWATIRASVQQNVLIGQTKDETATPADKDGIPSNTLVAAGLGLKHGNFILDGSLTAAGSGNINGSQFLSQASITYNF